MSFSNVVHLSMSQDPSASLNISRSSDRWRTSSPFESSCLKKCSVAISCGMITFISVLPDISLKIQRRRILCLHWSLLSRTIPRIYFQTHQISNHLLSRFHTCCSWIFSRSSMTRSIWGVLSSINIHRSSSLVSISLSIFISSTLRSSTAPGYAREKSCSLRPSCVRSITWHSLSNSSSNSCPLLGAL